MQPIKFAESNCTYAENQPEYLPLPVFKATDGTVVSCWKLSWRERIKILFTGKMWSFVLTFNQPLQPQLMQIEKPLFILPEESAPCQQNAPAT